MWTNRIRIGSRLWLALLASLIAGQAWGQAQFPIVRNYLYQDRLVEREGLGAIVQDSLRGLLYFGNSNGVQIFDGRQDHLRRQARDVKVSAMAYDERHDRLILGSLGKVYVADLRADGSLHNLRAVAKSEPSPGFIRYTKVEKIFLLDEHYAFYTKEMLLIHRRDNPGEAVDTVRVWTGPEDPTRFRGALQYGEKLVMNTDGKGLLEYYKGEARYANRDNPLPSTQGKRLSFVIHTQKYGGLIGMSDNRLYQSTSKVRGNELIGLTLFTEDFKMDGRHPVGGVVLQDKRGEQKVYLVATRGNGCSFVDYQNGNVIKTLNSSTGLRENEILDIFKDREGRVWLLHPNSFSLVYAELPIFQFPGLIGRVNALKEFGTNLFAATDDGIYLVPNYNSAEEKIRARVRLQSMPTQAEVRVPSSESPEEEAADQQTSSGDVVTNPKLSKADTARNPESQDEGQDGEEAEEGKVYTERFESLFTSEGRLNQFRTPQSTGLSGVKCYDLARWRNLLLIGARTGLYILPKNQVNYETQRVNTHSTSQILPSARDDWKIFVVYSTGYETEDFIGVINLRSAKGWGSLQPIRVKRGDGQTERFHGNVNGIFEDAQRRLWVSTDQGLRVLQSGDGRFAEPVEAIDLSQQMQEASLIQDAEAEVQLEPVSYRLFAVIEGRVWEQSGERAALTQNQPLTRLLQAGNGPLHLASNTTNHWMNIGSKVYKYRFGEEGELSILDTSNITGFLPPVDRLTVDGDGDLWVASHNEVFMLKRRAREFRFTRQRFRTFLGQLSWSGEPLFQRAISDSVLLLPQKSNGFRMAWDEQLQDSVLVPNNRFELPYGSNYILEANFFAPSYDSPGEKTHYEYAVITGDQDSLRWRKTIAPGRFVFNLAESGTNTFYLRVVDAMGNVSRPLRYEVHKAIPPWFTAYAIGFYCVLLVGGFSLWHYLSQRKIRRDNQRLNQMVSKATADLQERNQELESQKAILRDKNQLLGEQKEELAAQQEQLVESEKMAAVGYLVTNVAHEVNTPLGSIKSAAQNLNEILPQTLRPLPEIIQTLPPEAMSRFIELIDHALQKPRFLSTREERQHRERITEAFEAAGIQDAETLAQNLIAAGLTDEVSAYADLFRLPQAHQITQVVGNITSMSKNAANIEESTAKTQKIVYTLRAHAYRGSSQQEIVEGQIADTIDSTLNLYQSSLSGGISVEREYDELPDIPILPDELSQVWTNLITNAIQAMEGQGEIFVQLQRGTEEALVRLQDNGPGIPPELREKVFRPLFTTKSRGEGTGMGLHICRDIIHKHGGTMEIEETGTGTSFLIRIPFSGAG